MNTPLPNAKKITFTALALENGYLPPFSGHILRGIILKYFEYHDPLLMSLLHEDNDRRPYAIKDLRIINFDLKRKSRQTGMYRILQGEAFTFELTLIGSDLTERSIKSLIKVDQPSLQFQQLPVIIQKLELATLSLNNAQITKANGKYFLRFVTPLQFMTTEDNLMPFPIPEKLFRSLGETWNTILPDYQININTVINLAKMYTYVRAYELKTSEVDLGKSGKQVGFKGWMQLVIKNMEEVEQTWLPHLLFFGQVMNAGRYRTAGMGQLEVQKRD